MATPSIASAFLAKGHPNTIYWKGHGVKGSGTLKPDVHGSLARYLDGPSVGSMQGEHQNKDLVQDYARHPSDPLGLGTSYVVTKEDMDDLEYIDVNGAPAYAWVEREALKLGIDPRGDQATKPTTPPTSDAKARAALQAIKAAADKTKKPAPQGGGVPAQELRKLLAVIAAETAKGLAA